ncbi:MAG TPA: hypothetical protein VG328_01470 [Stellaceae bacterium]|jgi:hypothetical protein|nr:hypothetical protein [Stellaceae bacterium]
MRKIAGVLIVTAAISLSAAPFVRAQDSSSQQDSQGHVKQHQQLLPPSATQKDQKGSDQMKPGQSAPDQSAPGQSAQAPQSPAVITPPTTGDKSVITPPDTGIAKTPVIKPPGNKDDIQPK